MAWLVAVQGALVGPPLLAGSVPFQGNIQLFATIEIIGAVFGLLTGFALALRFYSLGNRYHLFLGLAYFVNGVEDLIHGLLCLQAFPSLLAVEPAEFIPEAYLTGQLLMGLTLLLALVLPDWLGKTRTQQGETIQISLIVLLLTAAAALLIQIPMPIWGTRRYGGLGPIEFISASILFVALVAYLHRYARRGEMLTWWIALSVGINLVGQVVMLESQSLFDGDFVLAHCYKVLGYVAPLLGFILYQITVVAEYERSRRDLIAAREEALAADRAKSEFLANISHEIRTPMNGILGMTTRLLRGQPSSEQRECLVAVKSCADGLLAVVDQILDLSKIEAGRLELERRPFPLRSTIEGTVAILAATAEEKRLALVTKIAPDLPDEVVGDMVRLRQVLLNLIGNAIKFTDQGSVTITCSRAASSLERDLVLEVAVTDTGIGIPPDKQRIIFDAFSQADGSTARRFGGTGLGLAISARLVQKMGGVLEVDSAPGRGSTFRFFVHLGTAPTPAREVYASARTSLIRGTRAPRRVLVVDDNPINQRVSADLVREMGHWAAVAASGQEALEVIAREEIDIVLMDVQMPQMSGLDATRAIRRLEQGQSRRRFIIAVTARAMPGDDALCLECGMDAYLAKPVRAEELFALLEGLPAPQGSGNVSVHPDRPAPMIEWTELRARYRGREQLLGELIAILRCQFEECLPKLAAAAESANWSEVAEMAHKLAGSVSNFSAPGLLRELRDWQDNAGTALGKMDVGELLAHLRQFETELSRAAKDLSPVTSTH